MTFDEFFDDYIKARVHGDIVRDSLKKAFDAGTESVRKEAEARVDRLLKEFVLSDSDQLRIL